MGLPFNVNPYVLIPRQDTEVLVEVALEVIKELREQSRAIEESSQNGFKVLDMCTGSGCILISILYYAREYFPKIKGVGADISKEAIKVAKENAKLNNFTVTKVEKSADIVYYEYKESEKHNKDSDEPKITLIESNLFSKWNALNIEAKENKKEIEYNMILSNPPYIPTKEIETLEKEVKDHEPMLALDGREDGLYFYNQISKDSRKYLTKGGVLIFECGWNQGKEVSYIMKDYGFTNVNIIKDLAGLDRVVIGNYG
jgi:release factor glutamine methyltransferase